ncbi:hypothetical protein BDZ89DRAFT_1109426 [Hymenopellis radicata]|nr:hypothetical protein BDZ89DRAFT_1109426 [Hymenopellis radicata]
MHFNALAVVPLVAAALSTVVAAPSAPATDAVQYDCDNAYNGMTPSGRGPGYRYACWSVSFVYSSYVCHVGGWGIVQDRYCCSGEVRYTSVINVELQVHVDIRFLQPFGSAKIRMFESQPGLGFTGVQTALLSDFRT